MKNTCRFELIIADLTKKDRLLAVNPEINIGLDRTLQQIGTWLQASIVPVCSRVFNVPATFVLSGNCFSVMAVVFCCLTLLYCLFIAEMDS